MDSISGHAAPDSAELGFLRRRSALWAVGPTPKNKAAVAFDAPLVTTVWARVVLIRVVDVIEAHEQLSFAVPKRPNPLMHDAFKGSAGQHLVSVVDGVRGRAANSITLLPRLVPAADVARRLQGRVIVP